MSETNKAIIRRYVEEVINQKNLDAIGEFWAPDLTWHGVVGTFSGLDQLRQLMGSFMAALPDLHADEGVLLAEGDLVAAQWNASGTHRGELFGVPATGKTLTWQGMDIYRLEDGKIVEHWAGDDVLSMLQQVGAFPPPSS